jgi:hypothetical protein
MNSSPVHILTEAGILTAFQVAKKVTADEINKYVAKQKKAGKKEDQIAKLLREKITAEVNEALTSGKIPGLILPEDRSQSGLDPKVLGNLPDLNRIILVVTEQLVRKQYDKMSMCYVINSMVNLLGLTAQDFEKFHQQRSDNSDDDRDDGANAE